MDKYSKRPTGDIPGSMPTGTGHMTERNMALGGASQESLKTGTTMRQPIGKNVFEALNIPGANKHV